MSSPKLSKERREVLIPQVRNYLANEYDMEVGDLKAGFLIDFFLETVGTAIYNEGVQATQRYVHQRMEDMYVEMDQILL